MNANENQSGQSLPNDAQMVDTYRTFETTLARDLSPESLLRVATGSYTDEIRWKGG
jgi:hypothetical protein